MKQIILTVGIILMLAGNAFAADPNSMPNPTAKNPVVSCTDGNFIHLIIYAPNINHRIIASEPSFPSLMKSVVFRYMDRWVEKLFEKFNEDMNLLESHAARQKRDIERIR